MPITHSSGPKASAVRLLIVAVMALAQVAANGQEIRAFWADGFSEGFKSPEQVDTLIRRLQTAHCNAVFAQMRKGGDAYYLSRYEPWAADNPQHFDALAYLIEKAHACKPRIQVHAWINTCAVGKTHGNPHHIIAAHPDWKSLSDTGEDYDNEATKIDPGHPDAADWTFRVYLDVVRHYDVDGIHFDFVRYGSTDGKGRWGYNPVSVARFNARYGRSGQPKWEDPLWKQWRRDQVTALVRKVYVMTQAIRPEVAISAATITWQDGPHDMRGMSARKFWLEKSPGMNRVFQDWPSWLKEGILDINCQMSYYQEKNHPDWFRHWIEWGKQNQFGRWVVPGCGCWLNSIPESIQQIDAIQRPGRKGKRAAGALLYSYAGTNAGSDGKEQQSEEFFAALAQPSSYATRQPFKALAEFPPMPWKKKSGFGSVKGFVLTADALTPVDGAKVTLQGKANRVLRTDGTGFYGFVDVPRGKYEVTVEAKGYSRRSGAVLVGDPDPEYPSRSQSYHASQDFFLGEGADEFNRATRMEERVGTPVKLPEVVVEIGTDTCPGNLFVRYFGDVPYRHRIRLRTELVLPLQEGDVVSVIGALNDVEGERVVDATAVRLVDMFAASNRTNLTPPLLSDLTGLQQERYRRAARIRGRVMTVLPDRAVLDASGVRTEVMLAARKPPGVEDAISTIAAPEAGSIVDAEGVCTSFSVSGQERGIRVFPDTGDAVRVIPLTLVDRIQPYLRWSWLPIGAAFVPFWLRRRRRVG